MSIHVPVFTSDFMKQHPHLKFHPKFATVEAEALQYLHVLLDGWGDTLLCSFSLQMIWRGDPGRLQSISPVSQLGWHG